MPNQSSQSSKLVMYLPADAHRGIKALAALAGQTLSAYAAGLLLAHWDSTRAQLAVSADRADSGPAEDPPESTE